MMIALELAYWAITFIMVGALVLTVFFEGN